MGPVGAIDHTRRPRAPARRPRAVLVDVFETMLQVRALGTRFVDVGRPAHEWELFLARTQRDGMALTLAGGVRPFTEVARSALRSTTEHTLSEDALDWILAGFRNLPPHPDVEPALMALARARIPVYAFTNDPAMTACAALDRIGLRTYLRGVLSTEEINVFTPPPLAYHWACQRVDATADRVALLAVHAWDVHGAVRAGLIGAMVTRMEGGVAPVVCRPHVWAERLDEVVDRLLELPA
jgi:2-haloacid dehalogenase